MLLDSKELAFYSYDGDVNEYLDGVRRKINEMSESWTKEQKARCLEETEMSFKVRRPFPFMSEPSQRGPSGSRALN